MHIGFLSLESPFETDRGGGIAAYLRALIPGLVQAGHRVTVIANSRTSQIERYYENAVQVVPVRLSGLHWYLGKAPVLSRTVVHPVRQLEWSTQFYRAARRVFREDPVDVLESGETGALLLAHRPIAPLVVRLHGSNYTFDKHSGGALNLSVRLDRRLELGALRRAHAITSPSRFQAMEAARDLGCTPARIRVVPNPIAPEMVPETADLWSGGPNRSESLTVLYTGRLRVCKGTPALLQAAKEVQKKLYWVRFVLVGPWQMENGPEEWGLARTTNYGQDGVAWLGHLPWQKLQDWYRRAAVFVMPSYYEPFGISCLEAMAFGLPVVATRTGGLPEVIEDGVTGILVPPRDYQSLAKALTRVLLDADLRRRMGEAGRGRVLEKFTVGHIIRKMLQVYEKARLS